MYNLKKSRNLKIFIFILLAGKILSCETNSKSTCQNEIFINEIVKGDFISEIPPVNSTLLIFVKLNGEKMAMTRNYILYRIFRAKYKENFSDFKEFTCALFSEKLILKSDDFNYDFIESSYIFELVDTVKDVYDSKGIDGILGTFTEKQSPTILTLNEKQTDVNKQYSILYYLFKNEYFISFSDYSGKFSIMRQLPSSAK